MTLLRLVLLLLLGSALSSCGGSGGATVGSGGAGGYALTISGGTYNDGSGTHGLAVLATLRDSRGLGPGLGGGWRVTITGPGLLKPIVGTYDDGSPGSYASWWWPGLNPASGMYTATATDGTTVLTSSFTVSDSDTLSRPPLSRTGSTVSWDSVPGAGSYYYEVTDGTGAAAQSGYLNGSAGPSTFQLADLPDGSYSIAVYAETQSRIDLMGDVSPHPALPSRDNISVSTMDVVVAGGSPGSYNLSAAGGVLSMGQDNGVDTYGLVVWTSILANGSSPPASDWTLSVTGPGIGTPISFTYPGTDSHYVYWDFGTIPAAGLYTVTATTPGSAGTLSAQFTIPAPTEQLPPASGIGVTAGPNSYTVSWSPVQGAASYYVNLWADVGGIYTEVANAWVGGGATAAQIPRTSLTAATQYDVYVTACTADMTTMKALPPPDPAQVNMSDNTFVPVTFTAQ